jgi:hypothetical protein
MSLPENINNTNNTEDITISPSSHSHSPSPTQSDELIQKYRNLTIGFINQNKQNLITIFLQHSREASDEDRIGVLGINFLDFDKTSKVDVAYLPVRILEEDTRTQILERINVNGNQVIYFLMITPVEDKILEIDIRDLM